MKWQKKAVSLLLALCMAVSMLPTALATEAAKQMDAGQNPFVDVSEESWYYDAVQFVYENELMAGTSATTFEPLMTMNRAMVVQTLYNYEGKPAVSGTTAFSDVQEGAWYYDAVQWASANGITAGDGAGKFNPNANVTREQFAQFLYNYSGAPQVSGILNFPDKDQVSGWAVQAITWANQCGIVNGKQNDGVILLDPQGDATRAEAAAMLRAFVKLRNSGLSISVDQENATVTSIHQALSGEFKIEQGYSIQTITYSASNEDMGELDYTDGQVLIDETAGTWKLDDIQLLPGKNVVVVTAVDTEGNKTAAAVELTYDSGTLKAYSESEITYTDEEEGSGFINDIVVVILDSEATEEQREAALREACGTVNGEVVGQLNGVMLYQIQVERNDYDGLMDLCEKISGIDNILGAYCDELIPQEDPVIEDIDEEDDETQVTEETQAVAMASGEAVTPNDPWKDVFQGALGQEWDEAKPNGLNWWVEAVHALSAWSHNSQLNNIKIGIVDTGIDTSHEDLNIAKTMTSNVAEDHGTHVAGIIGATANNEKGITGLVWNKKIYSYDAYQGASTSSQIVAGVNSLVSAGAKVINDSNGSCMDPSDVEWAGQYAVNVINNLANTVSEDFIIVQSAGNDCVDSRRSGTFCSITDADALEHIIVVAAADKPKSNGSYELTDFSNYGENVTVAAPGKSIFSTIQTGGLDGSYGKMSGTSMAAPIVTGIASMVWSVNEDFSAAEVKDIVVSTADTDVAAYLSSDNTTYHMVNADAAVEEAIARISADGNVNGRFVDAATGSGLEVSYKVHRETESGEVVYSGNSDSDGSFSFDLPAGEYVIEANGELNGVRFITSYTKCKIIPNDSVNLGDIPISTEVGENTYRVVLEWGEEPSDLDSHMRADTLDGTSSVHVYYADMTCDYANLDVDDVSSYGPETITITDFASLDGFTYSVHNYSNRNAESGDDEAYNLAQSGAIIKVLKGNSLLATYEVPTNKAGTVWNVFSVDRNGVITTLNTFEFESSPSSVGSHLVENATYERRAAEKAGSAA